MLSIGCHVAFHVVVEEVLGVAAIWLLPGGGLEVGDLPVDCGAVGITVGVG